jgi:hypothetical protein
MEKPYLKKQQKTSNARNTMMRGSGKIRVKVIKTGKIEEIEEHSFDPQHHIKEQDINAYEEALEGFDFEPTAAVGQEEAEENMNASRFTSDSQITNFF